MLSGIQFQTVLDIFAGTGSLGIEALSRGAKRTVFVDNNYKAVETIKKNLELTQLSDSATVIKTDVKKYLDNCNETFDLILADPPYRKQFLIELLQHPELLDEDGFLVYETDDNEEIPDTFGDISQTKHRTFGSTRVFIFRKGK